VAVQTLEGPYIPAKDPLEVKATPVVAKPAEKEAKKEAEADDAPPMEGTTPVAAPKIITSKPGENHPFPRRLEVPEFPRGLEWLNTSGPLKLKTDLKGKFVLLDFWTYCCINCMHILPELKKAEKAYPNNLVVIGVHSAKFDTEKDTANIKEAILRYEIEHPVINDADHRVWRTYGIEAWPSLLLIDPEGNAVWFHSSELTFADFEPILKKGIEYYREKMLLDETPLHFELAAHTQQPTPLRFPGKILADEATSRLFISDSNNNRIVISGLDGKLQSTIGSGASGAADGDFTRAQFNKPQGMALRGDTLYVADTENHLIRECDLKNQTVKTIAGTGVQGRNPWLGLDGVGPFDQMPERFVGPPRGSALNSPWDLWVHKTDLFIAMAGPHQIWKMKLDGSEIGPFAGNGREDIVDGPLLPPRPFQTRFASFAQPSGLTSDGKVMYVADSEGSSIRLVPFDPSGKVRTIVGSAHITAGRLFEFGDVDGKGNDVRLQHALGVVYHDNMLYVADTYNNKIKQIELKNRAAKTIAGTGKPGRSDADGTFDEPSGLTYAGNKLYVADTNNHLIRVVDLAAGNKVSTLTIAGLVPPNIPEASRAPDFTGATELTLASVDLKPTSGKVKLQVELKLPTPWKINKGAPLSYYIESPPGAGPIDRAALQKKTKVNPPSDKFTIELPVSGAGQESLRVGIVYYYCKEGDEGLCKVGSVRWTVPVKVSDDGKEAAVLAHDVKP